jgi:hypothetical protein
MIEVGWRPASSPLISKNTANVYTCYERFNKAHTMSKEAVFTLKLEPELRASFMAETEASHRPASQVMRELMREFVQRQQDAREYDDFLRRKVDLARSSMHAGLGRANDEVDAEFAARRTAAASRV